MGVRLSAGGVLKSGSSHVEWSQPPLVRRTIKLQRHKVQYNQLNVLTCASTCSEVYFQTTFFKLRAAPDCVLPPKQTSCLNVEGSESKTLAIKVGVRD
jgi:hypothetical protein